ncbi:MAG TPA: ABC transporter permease subunit, partial [Steroidobacteraceae bacterium]|nr:ABC transporter permease subunit [Steroidobacteraceae bacterium]
EHILPNLLGLLLVQGTIQFSLGVIAEAGLSYVGLSAQPPTPSWGHMLNEAQTLTALAPYLALFPGFAVLLFVLGLNLLGEGLRRRAGPPA